MWCDAIRTFNDNILDGIALLFGHGSLVLFSQLRQDQRPYSRKDAREDWISRIQKPSRVCRIFQIYSAFKDRVLADSKISPNWRHDEICGVTLRETTSKSKIYITSYLFDVRTSTSGS